MPTGRVAYGSVTPGTVRASIDISRDEIEGHTGADKFWCQCVASTDDFKEYRSSKAYVGISFFRKNFISNPSGVAVATGETIEITCAPPEARPEPVITWEKDGRRLDTETRPRMSVGTDGTLTITNALPQDAGRYVCVGTNPAKVRKSKSAYVTVS